MLILGGEPFEAPVLMCWNYVGFSKEDIAQAQTEWEQGAVRFGMIGDGQAPRLVAPPLQWRNGD